MDYRLICEFSMTLKFVPPAQFPPLCCELVWRLQNRKANFFQDNVVSSDSYVQGHCRPTFCCLQHTIHWRKSCSSQPARTGPDVSRLPRGSQDHPQATGYTWYSLIIGEFIAETCQSCCPCTTILLQGGLVLKRATGFFNANGAQISQQHQASSAWTQQ